MPDRIGRVALAIAAIVVSGAVYAAERYDFGRPATPAEIAGWDIDASPSGAGLPPGHGDVRQGEAIFAAKCASCHGAHGEGKPMDRLVGGIGTLRDKKPEKTVGSFWPYATTLFDFVRRAMPLNAPQSLTARRSLCGFGLRAVPQRHRRAGHDARRRRSRQDQDAQPRRLRQRLSDAKRKRQTVAHEMLEIGADALAPSRSPV